MKLLISILLLFSIYIISSSAAGVTNPTLETLYENDNNVLRFALTLELLDSTFFTQFQQTYNRDAFINAGYAATVWDNLELLRLQEVAHVDILQDTLLKRTGQTWPRCEYNFSSVTNIGEYVGGGRLFENVGTGAYDGSISAIYNRTLQQAAATIATVEARHAAFINTLPGVIPLPSPVPFNTTPFPNSTDFAFTPMTVADYILPFIVPGSCPFNVTSIFPLIYVVVPVQAPNISLPQNPTQVQVNENDLLVLNYALTLELLEATFYNQFLGSTITESTFTNGGFTSDDYQYFLMVRAHENAHVTFLQNTITSLGGTPVANCTYNFQGITDANSFIQASMALENAGVSAYDGSANRITDNGLRQAAATIATVEARHAAYINNLVNRTNWFPSAQDTPLTPEEVIQLVSTNYIVSCPTNPIAPQLIVITPYSNETQTTSSPTSTPTSTPPTSTPLTSTSGGSDSSSSAVSLFSLSSSFVCLLASFVLLA